MEMNDINVKYLGHYIPNSIGISYQNKKDGSIWRSSVVRKKRTKLNEMGKFLIELWPQTWYLMDAAALYPMKMLLLESLDSNFTLNIGLELICPYNEF